MDIAVGDSANTLQLQSSYNQDEDTIKMKISMQGTRGGAKPLAR